MNIFFTKYLEYLIGFKSLINKTLITLMSLFLCIGFTEHAFAGYPQLEATFSNGVANGWAKVERWSDSNNAFTQEAFPPDGRGDQTSQRATFFGSATPHSRLFLLYHSVGWDTNPKQIPILLVHGATQNADQAWANPGDSSGVCGSSSCPSTGLAQNLSNSGHKVFAINFPQANGDGYFWAEQIADAIAVIKSKTGASKVDVVAWSKGSFNTRMYASSLRKVWGTPYQDDIRKMILIGGPNDGFDWSFRHGTYGSVSVLPGCAGVVNGPAVHTTMYCFYTWLYQPNWTYSSAYFPGPKQMLKRWDSVYPLAIFDFDALSTYHGGWGGISYAPGINSFLGSSLVDDLHFAGTPSSISTYQLCGNQNDIPLLHNEHTGPSDGIIFIKSCMSPKGISTIGGSRVVNTNHLELGWKPEAINQIKTWLNQP